MWHFLSFLIIPEVVRQSKLLYDRLEFRMKVQKIDIQFNAFNTNFGVRKGVSDSFEATRQE